MKCLNEEKNKFKPPGKKVGSFQRQVPKNSQHGSKRQSVRGPALKAGKKQAELETKTFEVSDLKLTFL